MNFLKKDIYISSSVNSIGKCLSWGPFLASGMNRSIVLINQTSYSSQITSQITAHSHVVTCVKWISDNILVSGDNGGNIIIWTVDDKGEFLEYKIHVMNDFLSGVTDISGIILNDDIFIVASCEDRWSLIKVSKDTFQVVFLQTKSYMPLYVHSVNVMMIETNLLISCGLSDGRVVCQCYDIILNSLSTIASLVGHEDAVMSIHSINSDGRALISSASLDCFIRVWEVTIGETNIVNNEMDSQKIICGTGLSMNISIVAVLVGHENWVTSINICDNEGSLLLVSTSMDKSVIVWRETKDNEYSDWVEETRLGQVGGNGLGFIGGSISPDGIMIASIGYQGTMIVWKKNKSSSLWTSVPNIGGHFDAVEDISWEENGGRFLISVSKDQTTRIHAPWRRYELCEWYEIGRPQVHGYDMTCVSSLNAGTFISGADEKISRVFTMNKAFHNFIVEVTSENISPCNLSDEIVVADALGLSNKVITSEDNTLCDIFIPKEDTISGRTLWPEVTKLYGHVFELFRISSHEKLNIVATSCKASVPQYADIIIWDTTSWTIIQRLAFHKLTVLRMRFSKNGKKMLSVSKDKQWALWQSSKDEGVLYELVAHSTKFNCHSKIIWDTDWTFDDTSFITVSRDKNIKLWNAEDGTLVGAPLSMKESINAVSTFPSIYNNCHVFALGMESGDIKIITFDKRTNDWSENMTFAAHHDWITRLSFNPTIKGNKCLLASCSKDRFVKIFEISLE